ncbi:MAG: hypothetical protein AUJ85_06280 [Elusimicrobia bacterium CG1_02_37_114]|nr:MAG: hypothetical protein AUJ85_06280 [Elusimicrobia bacterium CG1_02_37_114]PIV53269.1 MAG: hypothetical protein COS17_04755 [Elusimicrobia bacterium CG02_land_8_20_14_3_00_37_13]PIZ13591.1 MAG: hypothetical protein COY53_03975 [Elusimicrobia bacterium CG_4_10_14_0_8_um_filter_37_32]
MRLSDIIKKKEGKSVQEKNLESEIEQSPQISQPEEKLQEQKQEQKSGISPGKVYGDAINLMRDLLKNIEKNKVDFSNIAIIVKDINDLIAGGNKDVVAFCERATPDFYLCAHSVNVCILSTLVGYELKKSDIDKLSLCALLNDLGMIKFTDLVQKSGKLTSHEFLEIKKHPVYTVQLLENISGIESSLKSFIQKIVVQVHERRDGKGYPSGLMGENIDEFARIISIVDVYEALIHPRDWRDRHIPHEAIKMLIEFAVTDFDVSIIKAFIGTISLYPAGSYVRLNSGEIGKVIGSNPGLPTRPKVRIIIDPEGNRAKEQKIVDLSVDSMICVIEAIDETKIKISDKKLALELKAQRWWVKGT